MGIIKGARNYEYMRIVKVDQNGKKRRKKYGILMTTSEGKKIYRTIEKDKVVLMMTDVDINDVKRLEGCILVVKYGATHEWCEAKYAVVPEPKEKNLHLKPVLSDERYKEDEIKYH